MIEVKNLSKRYGEKLAVDGLDFVVPPGTVTGFLGPNGAGKSTTMRMIAGLDEPVNGLDPEGVLWIRNLLKGLAAEGRTVFVSSHLMSEMALTATRLVVIGRGRLIADTTVEEFVARAGGGAVTVRTPQAARLRGLLLGPDITVTSQQSDVLQVQGLTAEQIGTAAWQAGLPVFELTTEHATLEEAFMQLTDDSVDYRSRDTAKEVATR